jgi:sugar lactone lactonase YvrE
VNVFRRQKRPRHRPSLILAQCAAFLGTIVLSSLAWAQGNGAIVTVAGGSVGDGESALKAQLYTPVGIAADTKGNLYIADYQNHRVRKVGSDGVITTAAGKGVPGFSGDNGPATKAQLDGPANVAVDGQGNLYIADTGNRRVRRVGPDGIITTVLGGGTDFADEGIVGTKVELDVFSDIAVDANGSLYVADTTYHRIRKLKSDGTVATVAGTGVKGFSGDGTPATQAKLYYPSSLEVDGKDNLYIFDTYNLRIRKVDSSGTITTIAGKGDFPEGDEPNGDGGPATQAYLYSPYGMVADGAGNLYLTDYSAIRKITPDGIITTVAGASNPGEDLFGSFSGDGGPAIQARFNSPAGLTLDAEGNLLISDNGNRRIRKIDSSGVISTMVNGTDGLRDNGPATLASLDYPSSVTVDPSGNLFIADADNYRIRKVGTDGVISTLFGDGASGYSGDGGPAQEALFGDLSDISFDANGNFYLVDYYNNRIRRVGADGVIRTIAGSGGAGYASSFMGDGGPATRAEILTPGGIAFDAAGNLYFADTDNNRVRKIDTAGIISTVAGNGVLNNDFESGFSGDDGPATKAQLYSPLSVAVDKKGNLYIADLYNHRIRKVNPEGTITTVAGNGALDSLKESGFSGDGGPATQTQINYPTSVVVDPDGTLFIADFGNDRIRKVTVDGIISTVAGNGVWGDDGDNGPSAQATLAGPNSLELDRWGNLYVVESATHRVRKIIGVAAPDLAQGDMNGDGVVNLYDAILSLQIAINQREPSEIQRRVGDFNRDGLLDIVDTTLILRHVVEAIP